MSSTNSPGSTGQAAEDFACRYLKARGLALLERNYRCRGGELDLIMREGESLVFVEVRLRNNRLFASPAESVDRGKQRRLVIAAQHFLQRHRLNDAPCRFDLLALRRSGPGYEAEWLRNIIEVI